MKCKCVGNVKLCPMLFVFELFTDNRLQFCVCIFWAQSDMANPQILLNVLLNNSKTVRDRDLLMKSKSAQNVKIHPQQEDVSHFSAPVKRCLTPPCLYLSKQGVQRLCYEIQNCSTCQVRVVTHLYFHVSFVIIEDVSVSGLMSLFRLTLGRLLIFIQVLRLTKKYEKTNFVFSTF